MNIEGIKLYTHQIKAIESLKTGSVLCGGVGSGKSLTSLCYYIYKVCKGCYKKGERIKLLKPKNLYIITTARKRDTKDWEQEGNCLIQKIDNAKIVVDSWNNIKKYIDVEDSFFIFDEQRVIGYGEWTKSFLKITKRNDWILLTATPGDTWMDYMPVFIANGFYKNKTQFINCHVIYSRLSKFPKVERYLYEEKLEAHRKSILVFMESNRNIEKINVIIKTNYDKNKVEYVQKNNWNIYDNKPIKNINEFCFIIRKIINTDESKIKSVIQVYKETEKLIIFYNFNYERDLLIKACKDNKIIYGEWNGFNHDSLPKTDKWIYLVQYNSGSEGWNCIETNSILFYSRSYSYKMMTQAAGRINRLDTTYDLLKYYYLDSDCFIDKMIRGALRSKKNFNEKMVRGNYIPYNRREED